MFIIRLSKIEEDIILSLVGKEIIEFSAQAYHNGEFITVQMKMLRENGLFSASTLQIFHLSAQLNSVTFKNNMKLLNLLV